MINKNDFTTRKYYKILFLLLGLVCFIACSNNDSETEEVINDDGVVIDDTDFEATDWTDDRRKMAKYVR